MNFSSVATAFFFALMPAIVWLFLYYRKDYKDPEPKKVIAQTFLLGAVFALPFLALRYLLSVMGGGSLLISGITGVIIFALLEEIVKLSAGIIIVNRHKYAFNQIIDGVIYATTAALGFAFVENMFYFINFFTSTGTDSIFTVFIFRSLGTMLAHTIFSAMAGLIWAYAYFSKQISPFQKKHLLAFELKDFINREIISLHIIRQNILKARPSRRGGHEKKILVLEGIFLASFLHIIFNLTTTFEVFGKNVTFLVVPGVMGGFLYLLYLYTKKINQKIFKVI